MIEQCPVPLSEYPQVLLAHGGGGRLSHELVQHVLSPCFDNPLLRPLHDGAIFELNGRRVAFTTDSYVVRPAFFPGGDIGRLAVFGTANDLAMCGARPLFISCGLIIEEGLPMEVLRAVARSMRQAADEAGVQVVTGDTKVVERGKGDGVFINTSGIGEVLPGLDVGPHRLRPGDEILISGPVGLHGIAIMSAREDLGLEGSLESDSASVYPLVAALAEAGIDTHMLRDPTRGGVASALNEMLDGTGLGIVIRDTAVPVPAGVEGACEILGLDPLHVANEGIFIAVVQQGQADAALRVLRCHPQGSQAAIIGGVVADHAGTVVIRTELGTTRVLDMLSGEQLPRIC